MDFDVNQTHFRVLYFGLIPISILILVTNIPVVTSIIFNKKLHIPTFFFVLCLSIADVCIGLTCVGKLLAPREATHELCLLRMAFLISPVCASLFFMFLIALDRYIAISSALTYQQVMTPSRAAIAITAVWIYTFLVGFLPLMGWNNIKTYHTCSFLYTMHPHYLWFMFFSTFLLPLCANFITYIAIFKMARKHIRQIHALEASVNKRSSDLHPRSTDDTYKRYSVLRLAIHRLSENIQPQKSFKGTLNAVKTLVIVLGSFVLTWGPFTTAALVQTACGDSCHLKELVGSYLLMLGLCNSFFNPLIYAFWNKDFRQILKSTMRTCHRFCVRHRERRPTRRVSEIPSITVEQPQG